MINVTVKTMNIYVYVCKGYKKNQEDTIKIQRSQIKKLNNKKIKKTNEKPLHKGHKGWIYICAKVFN